MSAAVTVSLSRGLEAIISADDAEFTAKKWYAGTVSPTNTYAMRTEIIDGRKSAVYLHRLVARAAPGELVDHINGNTLDNRRENLRLATPQLNCVNRTDYKPASGFRGVYPQGKGWVAAITVNRAEQRERFESKEAAARWYDEQAVKHFGSFAVLNYPQEARN